MENEKLILEKLDKIEKLLLFLVGRSYAEVMGTVITDILNAKDDEEEVIGKRKTFQERIEEMQKMKNNPETMETEKK
jgi:hypothetical protein